MQPTNYESANMQRPPTKLVTEIYTQPKLDNFQPGNFVFNEASAPSVFDPRQIVIDKMPTPRTFGAPLFKIQIKNLATGQLGPLRLITPKMCAPFGLGSGQFGGAQGKPQQYPPAETVQLSFWDLQKLVDRPAADENAAAIETFYKSLFMMDELVLAHAIENRAVMFVGDPNITPEVVKYIYNRTLKCKKSLKSDDYYAPNLRLKARKIRGQYDFYVFDANTHQRVDPSRIVPKTNVRAVIECDNIWVKGNSFGVTWRLLQAEISARDNGGGVSLTTNAFYTGPVEPEHYDDDMVEDRPAPVMTFGGSTPNMPGFVSAPSPLQPPVGLQTPPGPRPNYGNVLTGMAK